MPNAKSKATYQRARVSFVALSLTALGSGCGGEEKASAAQLCISNAMYEVNVEERCLEAKVTSSDPCIVETTDATSGVGTAACLFNRTGEAYLVGHYSYTADVRSEGWQVFGVEVADSEQEHASGDETEPAACTLGRTLLREAQRKCELAPEADARTADCDQEGNGFSRELAASLPICQR